MKEFTCNHIHVNGRAAAIEKLNEIFPGDYEQDTRSSERAGYPVFRSVNDEHYYNYFCDLNDRFEINLENGETINIWIDEESEEIAAEAEAEMHEYDLTIGLFDKNTEKQEISTEAAKRIISEILLNKFDIFAFTMIDCSGVYKMNSTGRIVREPSIRIEIATDEEITETIEKIIDTIKSPEYLNQESIMVKHSIEKISFR